MPEVSEICKFLYAITPAGHIILPWARWERANEKRLIFDTLFNHFLHILRGSSHIPTTQACMLSFSYVMLGTLAEWGTNANDR